eukprot:gene4767-8349_t
MISAQAGQQQDNFRIQFGNQFQKVEGQLLKRKENEFEESVTEEDMDELFNSDSFELEEQEEQETTEQKPEEKGFLDVNEAIFIQKVQKMYPTISPKCLQGILWKRSEVLSIFNQTTSELFVSHYEFSNQLTSYIQQQQYNNTPLSETEQQEKINFLNEKIAYWVDEIKKTCEKSLSDYILKLGKRRNRALPVDSTLILKEWFLKNIENPYPTEEQKLQLEKETNLSFTQINNWFINKRVRIWKPLMTKLKHEGLTHLIPSQLKHSL